MFLYVCVYVTDYCVYHVYDILFRDVSHVECKLMHILLYANSFYLWLMRLNMLFIIDADISSFECAFLTIAFIGPQKKHKEI